ncbi:MAG: helix-turn-helix transcriptional regulator [Ruminococcaceae bacterium]|nr:helix-turn-helix transcriptional regulator [Oscillospiraceae bacterium]
MDQIKIGKFIAECRKKESLTQMQLAEKLNITDRAVSKWERGKSLPDSAIMLELCGILKITVNDLLSGEVIMVDNYNKEMENKLLEMVKQKEESDKRLLTLEWVIGILSVIIIVVPAFVGKFLLLEEWQQVTVALSGFIPGLVGISFAVKIEQVAGYYQCKECGHKYVPTFKAVFLAMHMGRTRYMKCPRCGKKSWQKKVISKD